MPRLVVVAALLAASLACTPVLRIEARITLTSELQASLTYPVQVAFETDVHAGKSHTLCDARTEDWLVVLEDDNNECAEEMFVRAVLGPWTAPMTGCTEGDGNAFAAVAENTLASANGIAYEGFDTGSGGCKGADDAVELELVAVE